MDPASLLCARADDTGCYEGLFLFQIYGINYLGGLYDK